jgi:hypothetical protein
MAFSKGLQMEARYAVYSPDCTEVIGYVSVPKNQDPYAEASMALDKAINLFKDHVAVAPTTEHVQ